MTHRGNGMNDYNTYELKDHTIYVSQINGNQMMITSSMNY